LRPDVIAESELKLHVEKCLAMRPVTVQDIDRQKAHIPMSHSMINLVTDNIVKFWNPIAEAGGFVGKLDEWVKMGEFYLRCLLARKRFRELSTNVQPHLHNEWGPKGL